MTRISRRSLIAAAPLTLANLDLFVTASRQSGTGYTSPEFDAPLRDANSTLDPAGRMANSPRVRGSR